MWTNRKHTRVFTLYAGGSQSFLLKIMFLFTDLCLYKLIILLLSLSVGWSQCPGRPGKTHTNLRGLQCQPKSPSSRQLVSYALPVPSLSSTGVCHVAFLSAWLRQPAITVTHLQGDAHPVLQTGRLPERAGEDLGGWGETEQHWMRYVTITM